MTIDEMLDRPRGEGVRRRALDLLEQAVKERGRIDDPEDPEAMHDFRVALRRLRAHLKTHRDALGKRVGRLRKRLGDVASLTGDARDAEVQIAWLAERRTTLTPARRGALDWLSGRLEERKRAGYQLARARAGDDLADLAPRLRRRLRRYEIDLASDTPEPTYAMALARRVDEQGQALHDLLEEVTDPSQVGAAHNARIAGKQLRYLLEPLVDAQRTGAEARAAVKALKKLQDVLGELHDVHVLGHLLEETVAEADMPRLKSGLAALADVVRQRRDDLFRELSRAKGRLPHVGAVTDSLVAAGLEIERKYLLSALPPLEGAEALEIEQGYLPGSKLRERLRMTRAADGKVTYVRGLKLGAGLARTEIEEPCPEELFRKLWPLTAGKRVKKRRYKIPVGELIWEIDELISRPVVLAEVELPSEDTPVVPPEWLAPVIVREVTGEPDLTNEALAT